MSLKKQCYIPINTKFMIPRLKKLYSNIFAMQLALFIYKLAVLKYLNEL